jgi:hypothetical protein
MSRELITRALALVALGAILAFRSDSRGNDSTDNPKAATQSTAKPQVETPPKPMAKRILPPFEETAVQHALAEPADFSFDDRPLKEVADFIADHFKISVLLDEKSLNDAGVTGDTAITENIKDLSLRSALYLGLAPKHLAWVENSANVLMITTADVAKSHVILKVYDVRGLAEPANDFSAEPVSAAVAGSCHGSSITFSTQPGSWDGLREVITSTVSPASWADNGGGGSLSVFDGDLIVSQTDAVQSQVAQLLTGLEVARQQEPAALRAGRATFIRSSCPPSARIEHALDSRLDLDFTNIPLRDVANYLRQKLGILVVLDAKALDDAGVIGGATLTFKRKNVTARVGLRDLLEPKGLDFVVDHEVVLITVAETANLKTVTVVYPVGDLMDGAGAAALGNSPYEALKDSITTAVRPASWDDGGGAGSIAPFAVCKALVVNQTESAQREIQDLLSMIRSGRKNVPERTAAASNAPVLRVYWLPWESSGKGADEREGQELVDMIRKLIEPKSWADSNAYIGYIHGALVVRQTPDVHRRIESFFAAINGAALRPTAPKATPAAATAPAVVPHATAPPAAGASPPAAISPSGIVPAVRSTNPGVASGAH